jgi:hypothetical protein
MRVSVRGKVYETVKEAADALGMTINGVYSAVQTGKTDKLGLGATQPRAITLAGIHFKSWKTASIALGFGKHYISDAMRTGSARMQARIEFAAQRYAARLEMDEARTASGKGTPP